MHSNHWKIHKLNNTNYAFQNKLLSTESHRKNEFWFTFESLSSPPLLVSNCQHMSMEITKQTNKRTEINTENKHIAKQTHKKLYANY